MPIPFLAVLGNNTYKNKIVRAIYNISWGVWGVWGDRAISLDIPRFNAPQNQKIVGEKQDFSEQVKLVVQLPADHACLLQQSFPDAY